MSENQSTALILFTEPWRMPPLSTWRPGPWPRYASTSILVSLCLRRRANRQSQMRCKPGQNTDLLLREPARARCGPAGVEGVDILNPHRLPDTIDERQIVRLAGIAQFLDRRKAARFARFEPATQGQFTPPQHLQKRAALPQLRPLALTARRVFFFRGSRSNSSSSQKKARASCIGCSM